MRSDRRSFCLPQLIAFGASIAFATAAGAQTYGQYRPVQGTSPGGSSGYTSARPAAPAQQPAATSQPSYRPAPSPQPVQSSCCS